LLFLKINFKLLSLLVFILFLSSCVDLSQDQEIAPSEWQGHKVLIPKKKSHKYTFQNFSQILQTPHQIDPKNPTEHLIQPIVWASTCSGELNLNWKGYHEVEEFEEMIAQFVYQLKDLKFEERTKMKSGNEWKEIYTGSEKPTMIKNGKKVINPMGEMLGDPKDYFIHKNSRIFLLPNAIPAKKNGKIFRKASYMKNTADIGQYFLKGVRVEELAHKLFIMLPPLGDQMKNTWKNQVELPVLDQEGKKLVLNYESIRKKEVFIIKFSGQLSFLKGKNRSSNKLLQWYTLNMFGDVAVDINSGMPIEIAIKENISWVEFLPFQNAHSQDRHQLLKFNVSNVYKANIKN
jgi:hypothetical protein